MRRLRTVLAVAAALSAALASGALACPAGVKGVLEVSDFKTSPAVLTADGWGIPRWNVWPNRGILLPIYNGCWSRVRGHGEPVPITVSGTLAEVNPELTYRLEYRPAGEEQWQVSRELSPRSDGRFRVVWWQGERPCPRQNVSFRITSIGSDGSLYESGTIRLGVQPKVGFTYRPWVDPIPRGTVVRFKVKTPPDVRTIRVRVAWRPVFDPRWRVSPKSGWKHVGTFRSRKGVFNFRYRLSRKGHYVFRIITSRTEGHEASHLLKAIVSR